jgi:hypothetical protein
MNNNIIPSKVQGKICEACGIQKTCRELPGICVQVYFIPFVLVVTVLLYLFITVNFL